MLAPGLRFRVRSGLAVLLLAAGTVGAVKQQASKVRAVLFYSPTCPHCHQVMTVDLPPLMTEFGQRLQIVAVSTATPVGARLYEETVRALAIPDERTGVPTLVVGSTVLVGSSEIPQRLPGLVRQALAGNGVDWPAIAAVRELLQAQGLIEAQAPPEPVSVPVRAAADSAGDSAGARGRAAAVPAMQPASPERRGVASGGEPGVAPFAAGVAQGPVPPAADTASRGAASGGPAAGDVAGRGVGEGLLNLTGEEDSGGMLGRFRADPVANTAAIAVLFGMLLALGAVAAAVAGRLSWRSLPEWVTPVLALVGLGVAAYLAFVEVTGTAAVCGPVGDCNTVQQSPYARIAGLVPVGVLGVLGYLLLLAAWGVAVAGPVRHAGFARVIVWGSALLGTVFSLYLTFLEPFVIGATCTWCITSAVVMTVLLLLATPAALAVRAGRPCARP
jgi:uncharacterized membrane protein